MRMNQEINGPRFELPNSAADRIQHSDDSSSHTGGVRARKRTSAALWSYLAESCGLSEENTLS
jgi:hypothetical protein